VIGMTTDLAERSDSTAGRATRPRRGPSASQQAGAAVRLWPLSAIEEADADTPVGDGPPRAVVPIAFWVRTYLMRPHADLGRSGDVCPFTAGAARLDTVRIGVSGAAAGDDATILAIMNEAVRALDAIPCARLMRMFRTIIIGFPNCVDDAGLRVLKRVQNRLRPHSIFRGKMIGFFEPASGDKGLINSAFRPMRSPLPLLAVRSLVEQDAPFVVRNPLLTPIYLAKFPRRGWHRLIGALRR
jgi:hypothetical protein